MKHYYQTPMLELLPLGPEDIVTLSGGLRSDDLGYGEGEDY